MARDRSALLRVVGEFGLIFVGVALALAADDWREDRARLATARAALSAMVADLDSEYELLRGLAESYAKDDTSAARLLAHANDPDLSVDSVAEYVSEFYLGAPYAPSDASFTTALQTGVLEFVENDSLRLSVVVYFDQSGEVFSENFRELLNEVWELHGRLNPYLRPTVGSDAVSLWPYPSSPREVNSSWDEMRHDNGLLMQVLEFGTYAAYMVESTAERIQANRVLAEALRIELGESG